MTASSRTEHGSTSRPARISCPAAARRMVAASAVDMETGDGELVEARATRSAGRIVHASGPHLDAWAGMQLWWRFLDEAEYPHRAEVRVVEAQFASASRAALVLEVAAVEPDRAARRHARRPVSGSATLTAVECECIAGTDSIGAALHDISESGVGLVVTDDRVRPGDRFAFRARLPEGPVDTHVRVARVSRRPGGGRLFVGATLEPAPGAITPATRSGRP
jgi:PilZ domain-containing protein